MRCYYCQRPVDPNEQVEVRGLVNFLMDENDPMNPMFVDAFVHMTGATADNLDPDGDIVVCSRDAIRELFEGRSASA